MASIDLGADKANIAVAETLCSAQPVRDGTAAVSPALLGCRRFYDLEPSLQRSCEDLSDVEDEIQRERHFLLATISALRRAAEAALDRAETAEVTALECLAAADAAEQSQAATLKQLQAAEKSHAMQQSIELRIRDSVTAEVHATISAVSQEATAELRATVEEIKRLRADRSSSSNDHSSRSSSSRDVHANGGTKSCVDCRGHEHTTAEEAKMGHSCPVEFRSCDNAATTAEARLWISALGSSDASDIDVLLPHQGNSTSTNSESNTTQKVSPLLRPFNATVTQEFAPAHKQQRHQQQQLLGGIGGDFKLPFFCLQPSSATAAADESPRKPDSGDSASINTPRKKAKQPKPLRVRDVVSRLEQQRDASLVPPVARRRTLP